MISVSEGKLDEVMNSYSSRINNQKMKNFLNGDTEVETSNTNNVVSTEKLRKIQQKTLREAKEYITSTFGPMGSNTKIIKGYNRENISATYSKDGLKVLSSIMNSGPIEASIIEELIEMARHVEKEVGDGTTSTVILSSLIFDHLLDIIYVENIPPFQLVRKFNNIVDAIKDGIKNNGKECTLDDIYDISMVSTNGNEEVSNNIKQIYGKFGMDVDISVGISNTVDSLVKEYDGMVITEGMSDPAFINNTSKGTCEIRNARVYHFSSPIDTDDMIALFQAIIYNNILYPIECDYEDSMIPTVIVCPRISVDTSSYLKLLIEALYKYKDAASKPPILIITNVVASDELIMDDIANLCGCKSIHKYIDPKVYKKDMENGTAPTVETVADNFYGEAELVISDSSKTKFVNPKNMVIYDEDGKSEYGTIYTSLVNYLETEIKNAKPTDTAAEIGLLKKRLSALKASTVDYLVGGITIGDRDQLKDLVEDAVKNCASAAKYGVGRSANFEGLIQSFDVLNYLRNNTNSGDKNGSISVNIAFAIFKSYWEISKLLYGTVETYNDVLEDTVANSLYKGNPYDISSGYLPEEPSDNIKCSIMLDVHVLDTISKIITMMVTCNQCLLQGTNLNSY